MTALPTNWGIGQLPPYQVGAQNLPVVQPTPSWTNNPLFGLGAGLLAGSMQGRPGVGLQQGFQNILQQQRANEATALLGMRIQEMRRQNEARKQAQEAAARIFTDPMALSAYQAELPQLAQQLQFPQTAEGTTLAKNLQAAGLQPGTPEYQQAMMQAIMKPQVQIQQGQQVIKPAEAQQLVGPQGEKPPINMTWEQAQAAGFRYQSPAEQKEARTASEVIGRVGDSLGRYRETLQKIGPQIVPSKEKLELQAAYTDLLMESKELANLGALSGPDLDLIQKLLQDPTALTSQLLNYEDFKPQLDVIEGKIEAAKQRARKMYGQEFESEIVNFEDLPE